jgi:type III secretory pathway component EscR
MSMILMKRRFGCKRALVKGEVLPNMTSKHILSSLTLAMVLAAPAGMLIVPSLQGQEVQVKVPRVYDRDHKDYHNWDDREDKAYRGYLVENHQEYRPYAKMKRQDQSSYWTWRHAHPDVQR